LGGTQDAAYLTSAVVGPKLIEQYNSSELFVFTSKGEYANTESKMLEQVIDGRELINFLSASLCK
jgi:hypothetical protein